MRLLIYTCRGVLNEVDLDSPSARGGGVLYGLYRRACGFTYVWWWVRAVGLQVLSCYLRWSEQHVASDATWRTFFSVVVSVGTVVGAACGRGGYTRQVG